MGNTLNKEILLPSEERAETACSFTKGYYFYLKRILDVFLSVMALVVLWIPLGFLR